MPFDLPLAQQELTATVMSQGYDIGIDAGLVITIPDDFVEQVRRDLERHPNALQVRQLRSLAESAVVRKQHDLVYAVSTAGLARGGASEARFLLIRAKALPPWDSHRRRECIDAAAELGRRGHDMELVHEAVDLRGEEGARLFDMLIGPKDPGPLSDFELQRILKRERAAKKFVKPTANTLPPWLDDLGLPMGEVPMGGRKRRRKHYGRERPA